jgi:hypothetical protein
MEEIIDNVFVRATEFMHDSGLRMDADHVGKPQDLYLWCSVDGGKDWGLWGCPMRFTTGCPCAIRITESKKYLILQFHGYHTKECHAHPKMTGTVWDKRGPALAGFKSYYSPGKDSGGSGKSRIDFDLSCPILSNSSAWPRRRRPMCYPARSLHCCMQYYAGIGCG